MLFFNRGVAQLVARLLWEREARVRATALGKPGKPWDSWADSTFPVAGNWSKIGVDHMFDHNWKISYPGVAQLVARLLWEQDAGSSSLPTRTIIGQKNRLFRRFFFFLLNFLIEILYFTSYGLLLLVRPRI